MYYMYMYYMYRNPYLVLRTHEIHHSMIDSFDSIDSFFLLRQAIEHLNQSLSAPPFTLLSHKQVKLNAATPPGCGFAVQFFLLALIRH